MLMLNYYMDLMPWLSGGKARAVIVLLTILAWFACVLVCAGSVIVDGFQSLGAVSDSRYPGSLHWPMMGSFMGYDQTWGFHWIGWPLFRSLLLPVLAWNPLTEIILLCLMWGIVVWQVACLSSCKDQPHLAFWTGMLTLASPNFLVAAQSYRPEIPTALLLLMAIRFWNAEATKALWVRCIVVMLLPLFHPMGLVLPAAWCGWDFLLNLRRGGFSPAITALLRSSWPLLAGVMLMAGWFGLQSDAWEQFQWNVRSQRMLVEGMGTGWMTFFRWGFGSFSSVPLVVVLLGASIAALLLTRQQWNTVAHGASIHRASVGFLVAIVFNIATKNPNSLHLVAIWPMALWLFVWLVQQVIGSLSPKYSLTHIAFGCMLVAFLAYPIKLTGKIVQNGGHSYRGGLTAALEGLPPARKVLIPVALWEAAQMNKGRTDAIYQFSTFPNILARKQRELYEIQVNADMRAGDLLVWDPLQESGGIFNFVEETALRHRLLHPQDNAIWERLDDIRIPFSYSRSQSAMFQVYRFRGL